MQRLSRAWKPLAGATVLVGGPTLAYYNWPSKPQTFDLAVRVRGPDGRPAMSTRSYSLLSRSEVEDRLHAHVRTESRTLGDGKTWKWSTAQVASNDPIEDAHASAVLSRRDIGGAGQSGDMLFFSVMDGHGGYHTSRLLSKTLIPAVILELQSLASEPSTIVPKTNVLQSVLSSVFGRSSPSHSPETRFDGDPTYVSLALQTAFANLDSELINAPLRLLAENVDAAARASKVLPDLSQHPMALASMLPAMSGACAIMAYIDTANEQLYVANTGDSRAVAGFWDEHADGSGSWRMEVLSEDQTGRNPKEFLRVQSEHPMDEAPYVIQRGRILGGLEPSRAFGDARYKWSRETQQLLSHVFLGDKPMRAAPQLLKTPPYVTARPVITHLPLQPTPSSTVVRSTPRFLVLATDGLWDKLPSSSVASLVAGHLSGLRGPISASSLSTSVPLSVGSSAGVDGKSHLDRSKNEQGSWAFEDEDLSSHLIRNAFGGADERAVREMMSIPAPTARSFRDDVTVTVVVFPTGEEKERARL